MSQQMQNDSQSIRHPNRIHFAFPFPFPVLLEFMPSPVVCTALSSLCPLAPYFQDLLLMQVPSASSSLCNAYFIFYFTAQIKTPKNKPFVLSALYNNSLFRPTKLRHRFRETSNSDNFIELVRRSLISKQYLYTVKIPERNNILALQTIEIQV